MSPRGANLYRRGLVGYLMVLQLLFCGVPPGWSQAAALIRGPYLQLGTPTSMTLRWRTDFPAASVVLFGQSPEFLYQISGSLELKTDHEVVLTGLRPDTLHYYSVGTLNQVLSAGDDHYFRTSPLADSTRSVRIWAIGDCGTHGLGGNQAGVRDAYYRFRDRQPTDVWLALGDNAYFNGEDFEYQLRFFDIYPDILRNAVLWPVLGNHETYSRFNNGVLPYFDMFTLPTEGQAGGVPSGTENYYSFDYGKVHFIALDSEITPYLEPTAMLNWLRSDLEANTRDWTIAFWHTPPYSKGSHDSDEEYALAWMREQVVPILGAHGVDLVLSGHSHIYERTFLMHGHYGDSTSLATEMLLDPGSGRVGDTGAYWKQTTGPNANQGAVYVVAGSSGWATFRTGRHPAMYYDALTMGSLVLDVEGQTLTGRYLRDTGAVDDWFTMIKSDEPPPLAVLRIDYGLDGVAILFRSEPGRTYQVQHADLLDEFAWAPLGPDFVAEESRTRWTFRPAGADPARFFRVHEVTEP